MQIFHVLFDVCFCSLKISIKSHDDGIKVLNIFSILIADTINVNDFGYESVSACSGVEDCIYC